MRGIATNTLHGKLVSLFVQRSEQYIENKVIHCSALWGYEVIPASSSLYICSNFSCYYLQNHTSESKENFTRKCRCSPVFLFFFLTSVAPYIDTSFSTCIYSPGAWIHSSWFHNVSYYFQISTRVSTSKEQHL